MPSPDRAWQPCHKLQPPPPTFVRGLIFRQIGRPSSALRPREEEDQRKAELRGSRIDLGEKVAMIQEKLGKYPTFFIPVHIKLGPK